MEFARFYNAVRGRARLNRQRPFHGLERLRRLDPHEPDRRPAQVVILGPRHGHRLPHPFRNLVGFQPGPDRKDANEGPAHCGRRVDRFFHSGELLSVRTQLVNLFVELPDVAIDEILNDGVALWALGTDGLPIVIETGSP